jgi:hypothetical protein
MPDSSSSESSLSIDDSIKNVVLSDICLNYEDSEDDELFPSADSGKLPACLMPSNASNQYKSDFFEEEEEEYDLEDMIPAEYYPSNNYLKLKGIEYFMERNNLIDDPMMIPVYEDILNKMPSPSEDWEFRKNNKLSYAFI